MMKNFSNDVAEVMEAVSRGRYPRLSDMLFKPVGYDCGNRMDRSSWTMESLYVPFKVIGNNVYLMYFSDFMLDNDAYIEVHEENSEVQNNSFYDSSSMIREVRSVEDEVGLSYLFNRVDKIVSNYMRALIILEDKGFITNEQHTELLQNIGIVDERRKDVSKKIWRRA